MHDKNIFVSVGTTKFDKLIKTVLSNEVLEVLNKKGYNSLLLQTGTSSFPKELLTPRCGFLSIESFCTKPTLLDDMKHADLVISHAGAGTCLEVLELQKPLIVVINELLMDNHQIELAEQLYKDGHLFYCKCSELSNVISNSDFTSLIKFSEDKSISIARIVNDIMGFY